MTLPRPSDKAWKWSQTVRVIDFDFVRVTNVVVEGNFKNLCMTPEMYSFKLFTSIPTHTRILTGSDFCTF